MSGFKSYKIRDGVHIPSEKYKENWNAIFGKKPKKPKKDVMAKKLYTSDEDKMMQDKNLKWSEPVIIKKDKICEEQKLYDPEYITQGQIDNLKKQD